MTGGMVEPMGAGTDIIGGRVNEGIPGTNEGMNGTDMTGGIGVGIGIEPSEGIESIPGNEIPIMELALTLESSRRSCWSANLF